MLVDTVVPLSYEATTSAMKKWLYKIGWAPLEGKS